MCDRVRKLLREGLRQAVSWNDPPSADFVSFQWFGGRRLLFAVYRILVAVYFAVWLVLAVVWKTPPRINFLIYLTYWTLIVFICYLLLSATICVVLSRDTHKLGERLWMRRLLVINWALYYICADVNLFIVASFWLLEYKSNTMTKLSQDLHVHLFNGLFFLVNLALSAQPHNWAHLWVPAIYGAIYGTFMGRRYVYEVADFNKAPVRATLLVIGVILVAVPLLHTALWALTRLRVYLFSRYIASRDRVAPKSPDALTDLPTPHV